jgi:hypothetical protein
MADRKFIELHREHIENTLSALEPLNDEMNKKELAGSGAFIMNIYTGIENILRNILEEDKGEKLKKDGMWHKTLLFKSAEYGIISDELGDILLGYLKFRHLQMHGYGYMLEWDEFRNIAGNARNMVDRFFSELEKNGYL